MKISRLIILSIILTSLTFSQEIKAQEENKAFLDAPKITILDKTPDYDVKSRKFTGIPSMAISNENKLWATWYAGVTADEDVNNYIVLASSSDGGDFWTEELIVDPDANGPVRAFDPELWLDPNGKLWMFWAQAIGHDGTISGTWAMTSNNHDEENPTWSAPKRLTDGIMMCKPTVLSSGEWILPVSTWKKTDNSAKAVVSTDKGKTWEVYGGANVVKKDRNFDEHMIVEKKDGSLWMFVRTNYGIAESFSKDKGKTWTEAKASNIKHTNSRFILSRLQSGNLLLVKHGSINTKTGRSHLMAFISKDDGKSWSKGLLLDERKGISYPDGQQAKDGTIYIIYDYNRRSNQNILMTSFTEEDILSDDSDDKIIEIFNNRKVVSKGGK